MNLVIKDAARQILGRIASAIWGFLVIKIITPYLWPLRFGDYSTILKYFAIRSAFADFGLYVIALKQLGSLKSQASSQQLENTWWLMTDDWWLKAMYGKFVSTRALMIWVVYTLALVIAYFIPAYTSNPYLIRWLPLGMLFSASFMTAGIVQIPLQLFRKMEHVSIWLILARIVQLTVLVLVVYIFFADLDFSSTTIHTTAFNLILVSVLLSGIVQWIYVYRIGKKYLSLQRNRDWWFTKHILGSNRQYWFAYYLSSFHTLIVLILLSIFYPTVQWYTYVGTWALALALIEILLIVPSALGNSLIHKVSGQSDTEKKQSFGALLQLVIWIWWYVIVMFHRFAPQVINFIWGEKYLSSVGHIGSDYILPFLGIVITLSFVKQVFNYIFVSTDLQNKLLKINLTGVIIWTVIWVPLLLKYNIVGGIIMQTLLELCFMLGAIYIWWKQKVLPKIQVQSLFMIVCSVILLSYLSGIYADLIPLQWYTWILRWFVSTLFLSGISYPWLKGIMKKL